MKQDKDTQAFCREFTQEQLLKARHAFNIVSNAVALSNGDYVINDDNVEVIKALYAYFLQHPSFYKQSKKITPNQTPSLNKGIILCGSVGSGKTTLFKIFQILVRNTELSFRIIPASNVSQRFGDEDFFGLWKSNTMFDDLGKETISVNLGYANPQEPFNHLISHRYNLLRDKGILTHFTTNLSLNDLAEKYGEHNFSRLLQMCNIYTLNSKKDYRINRVLPEPYDLNDLPVFFPEYKSKEADDLNWVKEWYKEAKAKANRELSVQEPPLSRREKFENYINSFFKS